MSHQRVPKLGRSGVVLIGCVLAIVCVVGLLYGRGGRDTTPAQTARVDGVPLAFEPNLGQTDSAAKYIARGHGYTLFLTAKGAVWSLTTPTPHKAKSVATQQSVVRMELDGADQDVQLSASDGQAGVSNYFRGSDPKKWRSGVPHYGCVEYTHAYPGVDLAVRGEQQQLQFDFRVASASDPSQIAMQFSGTDQVIMDRNGNILLTSPAGNIALSKPVAYQEIGGQRKPVAAGLSVKEGKVTFALGDYDKNHDLYLSPAFRMRAPDADMHELPAQAKSCDLRPFVLLFPAVGLAVFSLGIAHSQRRVVCLMLSVLCFSGLVTLAACGGSGSSRGGGGGGGGTAGTIVYASFLGGTSEDEAFAIAVDSTGAAYLTGQTNSADFPQAVNGPPVSFDAFVAKISADGSSLVYSTYVGGHGDDSGNAIAVDSNGNVFVAGGTKSPDFPVNVNQTTFGGTLDAFVLRLDSAGALSFSTFLGGSDRDVANGIALDSTGVYVVGATTSLDFPLQAAFQKMILSGGTSAGFVTKLGLTGTTVLYSTYLGGSTGDLASAVAVDSSNQAYVTGETFNANFPVTNGAFQIMCGCAGTPDAFVTVFRADGSGSGNGLVYSTFLGGSLKDEGLGIAVHGSNAIVTGDTQSNDFPTHGAIQAALSGTQDAFVAELNASGSALVYSTYLGGTQNDTGTGVAVDPNGNAFVTGSTSSTNFPNVNATQTTFGGARDAFVTEINPAGSSILFSTFLGGSQDENTLQGSGPLGAIAVTGGNIYVAGNTTSTDFPTKAARQPNFAAGGSDAMVAKITP